MIASLPIDWFDIAIAFATLAITYTIFGMMGFGSALIAAPVLAQRLPLTTIVPLLAMLDLIAGAINLRRLSRNIAMVEVVRLAPLIALGSAAGIAVLMSIATRPMQILLGAFAMSYGLYGIFGRADDARLKAWWVVPFGLIGGFFSGLFGSGGFIYSIYLSHRYRDKELLRATMTTVTALSSVIRVAMFAVAGAFHDLTLLSLAAAGVPALLVGLMLGHRITLRISQRQFFRCLCLLVIGTGLSLVVRAFV